MQLTTALKYMKQKLTEPRKERNKSTITVRDVKIMVSVTDRKFDEKSRF